MSEDLTSQLAGQISYSNSLLHKINLMEQESVKLNVRLRQAESAEKTAKLQLEEARNALSETRRKLGVAQDLAEMLSGKAKTYRVQVESLQAELSTARANNLASSSIKNIDFDEDNSSCAVNGYNVDRTTILKNDEATELRQLRKIAQRYQELEVSSVADHGKISSLNAQMNVLENSLNSERQHVQILNDKNKEQSHLVEKLRAQQQELVTELQATHYRLSVESESRTNLERQMRESQRLHDQTHQQMLSCQGQAEQYQQRLSRQHQVVVGLEKELQRAQDDLIMEKDKVKGLEVLHIKMKEERITVTQQITTLRKELQVQGEQLQTCQLQRSEAVQEIETQSRRLTGLNTELEKLQSINITLEGTCRSERETHIAIQQQLHAQLATAIQEQDSLRRTNQSLLAHVQQQQQQLQQQQRQQQNSLQEARDDRIVQVKQLTDAATKAEAEASQLRSQLQTERDKQIENAERAAGALQAAQSRLNDMQRQTSAARSAVRDMLSDQLSLRTSIEVGTAVIRGKQLSLHRELVRTVNAISDQHKQLSAGAGQGTEEKRELQLRVESLTKRLEQVSEEARKGQEQAEETQQHLQQRIADYLKQAADQAADHNFEVIGLRTKITNQDKEAASLESRVVELSLQQNASIQQVTILQQSLAKAQLEIQTLLQTPKPFKEINSSNENCSINVSVSSTAVIAPLVAIDPLAVNIRDLKADEYVTVDAKETGKKHSTGTEALLPSTNTNTIIDSVHLQERLCQEEQQPLHVESHLQKHIVQKDASQTMLARDEHDGPLEVSTVHAASKQGLVNASERIETKLIASSNPVINMIGPAKGLFIEAQQPSPINHDSSQETPLRNTLHSLSPTAPVPFTLSPAENGLPASPLWEPKSPLKNSTLLAPTITKAANTKPTPNATGILELPPPPPTPALIHANMPLPALNTPASAAAGREGLYQAAIAKYQHELQLAQSNNAFYERSMLEMAEVVEQKIEESRHYHLLWQASVSDLKARRGEGCV